MRTSEVPDPFAEVQMVALRTLRGANFWSTLPVTRVDLAVGAYDEISTASVSGLTEALASALPGLVEHRCSVGERGGFLIRLRRGTYIPHLVEHLALELQSMVGHKVGYGRARGGDRPGEYTVAFEHRHAAVGRRAGALALAVAQRAFAGRPLDVRSAVEELRLAAASPDEPGLRRWVAAGITGAGDRGAVLRELIRLRAADGEELVEMSPAAILETGLPYSHSRAAVILDVDAGDVPDRYREPHQAQRLAGVVADAVPEGGIVVAPAGEPELHERILDAGRRVAVFTADEALGDGDARVAHAAATVRNGLILIDCAGQVVEHQPLRPDGPTAARVAALLTATVLHEDGAQTG